MMAHYAAFLRGINVGGHNMVKMEDLRKLFTSLGFTNVATYIQSGNIVFEASEKNSHTLSATIKKKLSLLLGSDVGVFVRTISSLKEMVWRDPFKEAKQGGDAKLYVTFLSEEPPQLPKLPLTSPHKDVEVFSIKNLEAFSISRRHKGRFGFPNAFIEAKLGTMSTTRNWETVKNMASSF